MMPTLLVLLTLLQAGVVPPPPPADEPFILIPYLEVSSDGSYCDWGDGHCGVAGRVPITRDLTIEIFRKITEQEAADEGRRRLLKHLAGLRIDSGSRLADRFELSAALKKQLDAVTPVSTDTSRARFEARLELPLRGQDRLISLALPAAIPSPGDATATTPAAVEAQGGDAQASFTGLIIDARHLVASDIRPVPALLPRILDADGVVLYSASRVEPLYASAKGIAAYMQWIHPFRIAPGLIRHHPREGERPLTVKAVSTALDARCDLVVSAGDASRIREAVPSAVLAEARVVILMPPPARPEARSIPRRAPQTGSGVVPSTDRP